MIISSRIRLLTQDSALPGLLAAGGGVYSLSFLGTTTRPPLAADQTDIRQSAMVKVPTDWRKVNVAASGGDSKIVEVRIVGFGAKLFSTVNVLDLTGESTNFDAHDALWHGGRWGYAASPCTIAAAGGLTASYYQFFWYFPSSMPCGKFAKIDMPGVYFSDFSFMYELKTPNPLDMPQGDYTGQLTYTVGPGQDFDFGDLLIPDDNALTLNFTLEVSHIFQVLFPPGSDRLALIPQGGWQQWVLHGRRPEKLFANQNFQLWASSLFKMQLQCQYTVGDQCGIQNEAGDLVPVETRVTLPPGLLSETNTPVNRHLLSISTPSIFHSTYYIDDGRATLNFEVGKSSVVQMTNHSGSRYVGNVTVVWDADI